MQLAARAFLVPRRHAFLAGNHDFRTAPVAHDLRGPPEVGGSREQSRRQHQRVVLSQGMAGGFHLLGHDRGGQPPSAKASPLRGDVLRGGAEGRHVNAINLLCHLRTLQTEVITGRAKESGLNGLAARYVDACRFSLDTDWVIMNDHVIYFNRNEKDVGLWSNSGCIEDCITNATAHGARIAAR